MRQIDLQARVDDLEYQLELLLGRTTRTPDVALARLCLLCRNPPEANAATASMCRSLLGTLGVRDLLQMSEMSRDPFPWKSLLQLCAFFWEQGFDMEDEFRHVYGIGQKLLAAQGLEKVSPVDLLL